MILYDLTIGVTSNLISNCIDKILEKQKKAVHIDAEIMSVKNEEPLCKSLTYAEQVANRLQLTKEMMSHRYNILTTSKISNYLNYDSVTLIDDYFQGKQEPTISFLGKYSEYFGLELDWLRHGEGNKYKRYKGLNCFPLLPRDYKKQIIEKNPEQIYFVRSKGENGDSGIVLKLSNYKYLILPRTYNVSSHVGGTGQSQIESFFDLIRELSRKSSGYELKGLMLDSNEFLDLFQGELYPGKYFDTFDTFRQLSYWWDDFLDFKHELPIAKDYEHLYGNEFLFAQEIVRYKKEKS